MMTKENFDEVYEEITTGFCPLSDDRIPNEYLLTETAPGEDELAPTEVDPTTGDSSTTSGSDEASASTSASEEAASTPSVESTSDGAAPPSNEIGWNPDQPTLPPRVIVDDDAKPEEGVGAGQWNPIYPSDPPIPAPSNDPQVNAWTLKSPPIHRVPSLPTLKVKKIQRVLLRKHHALATVSAKMNGTQCFQPSLRHRRATRIKNRRRFQSVPCWTPKRPRTRPLSPRRPRKRAASWYLQRIHWR